MVETHSGWGKEMCYPGIGAKGEAEKPKKKTSERKRRESGDEGLRKERLYEEQEQGDLYREQKR